MATVHIRLGGAMGAGAPVYAPIPSAAESLTSSGVSQATTIAAEGGEFCTVKAIGGPVYIRIGDDPEASIGSGDLLGDGDRMDFGPLRRGDRIAVIDAE